METFLAAANLVNLACQSGKFVQSVFKTPGEIESLSHWNDQAVARTKALRGVVYHRGEGVQQAHGPTEEAELVQSIHDSLDECQNILSDIADGLEPFRGGNSSFITKIRFVCSGAERDKQRQSLKTHFQDLTLLFTALTSVNGPTLSNDHLRRGSNSSSGTSEASSINPQGTTRTNSRALSLSSITQAPATIAPQVDYGWNALHRAALELEIKPLRELLDSELARDQEFLDSRTAQGETALIIVAKFADNKRATGLAKALIDKGCNVDLKDNSANPPHCAARSALYHAVTGPIRKRLPFLLTLVKDGRANVEEFKRDWPLKYERLLKDLKKSWPEEHKTLLEFQAYSKSRDQGHLQRRNTMPG